MMSNLQQRLITASLLIPIAIFSIFFLPLTAFRFFNAGIFMIAAWEWARLSGITKAYYRGFYSLTIVGCAMLTGYLPMIGLFIVAALAWLIAIVSLLRYPRQLSNNLSLLMGILILPACWQGLNILCFLTPRPDYLLTLFVIIWSADSVAYFAGSRWGKHKLAPLISPGKSIEGVIAALLFNLLIAIVFAKWQHMALIKVIAISLVTVIAAIVGDLFESLLKRQQQLKDSGNCLPGHGGVLDRLDSLTAAIPIFVLGLLFFLPLN